MITKKFMDEAAINLGDTVSVIVDLKSPAMDEKGGSNSVVYGEVNAIGEECLALGVQLSDDEDDENLTLDIFVPYSKIAFINRYIQT